jgi:hypothetical protein
LKNTFVRIHIVSFYPVKMVHIVPFVHWRIGEEWLSNNKYHLIFIGYRNVWIIFFAGTLFALFISTGILFFNDWNAFFSNHIQKIEERRFKT